MATDVDELEAGDAAILDALYREAPAEGGGAGLDDAQQATLDEWRAVLGVVRQAREEGFDVEPPTAGTRGSLELLMTAARAHATPARPGLWARLRAWLTPMLAHPAMAGAAALVVVGGAAGVLYLKGQHRAAGPPIEQRPAIEEPRLPSPITDGELRDVLGARQPDERPGPASGSGATLGTGPRDERDPANGTPTTTPAVTEGLRPGTGAPRGGERRGPKALPKPPEAMAFDPAPTVGRLDDDGAGGGGDKGEESPRGVAAGEDRTLSGRGTAPGVIDSETAPAPTVTSRPPPPPPAPPPSAPIKPPAPARPAQIAVDDAGTTARVPSRRAQAEQLTAEARAAAKAGACAKVVETSRLVFALDPGYHRDVFVRDPDIARCR